MKTLTLKAWAVYVGSSEAGFPCAMFHWETEARMYAAFAMVGLEPRVEQITLSTPKPEWAVELADWNDPSVLNSDLESAWRIARMNAAQPPTCG